MLRRLIARSLMVLVPERRSAVVTLRPDSPAPVSVDIANAWLKPLDVRLGQYGGLNLQGDETRINIPQRELNGSGTGYDIRTRDRITIDGATFTVLSATLKSVRTRWECIARKVME